MKPIVVVTLAGIMFSQHVFTLQHPGMPPSMTHEEHQAQMKQEPEMKRRSTEAMGFDQDKTTHHFRLTPEGGLISVAANSPDDTGSRDRILEHLKAIAEQFQHGDFGKPTATHAAVPPGVETMQREKDRIRYTFEEARLGGQVRIASADASTVAAIHEFLKYQIREHATGDPLTVQR